MYCTVEDIQKELSNASPKKLGYKDKPEEYQELMNEWIKQSESLINSYCRKTWKDEIPDAVKNVCLRLISNMIEFYNIRKDTPIINPEDFTIKNSSSEIFTQDLKNDLKPFRKTKKISVFNI